MIILDTESIKINIEGLEGKLNKKNPDPESEEYKDSFIA